MVISRFAFVLCIFILYLESHKSIHNLCKSAIKFGVECIMTLLTPDVLRFSCPSPAGPVFFVIEENVTSCECLISCVTF